MKVFLHGFAIIISILITLTALSPCLGWMNWFVIPMLLVQLVFSGVCWASEKTPEDKQPFKNGLIAGVICLLISIVRLIIGAGVV